MEQNFLAPGPTQTEFNTLSSTVSGLSDQIASVVKNEVITFTTNTGGNYSPGSSWGLTKRIILGIYNDRSDSNYDTTASFFSIFTSSGNASNGNVTIRVTDTNNAIKASTAIKARIFYIEL